MAGECRGRIMFWNRRVILDQYGSSRGRRIRDKRLWPLIPRGAEAPRSSRASFVIPLYLFPLITDQWLLNTPSITL